jgi:hypothetical protein
VPLADAHAAVDPLVGRVNHLLEVFVGKQTGRNVGSEGADLSAS